MRRGTIWMTPFCMDEASFIFACCTGTITDKLQHNPHGSRQAFLGYRIAQNLQNNQITVLLCNLKMLCEWWCNPGGIASCCIPSISFSSFFLFFKTPFPNACISIKTIDYELLKLHYGGLSLLFILLIVKKSKQTSLGLRFGLHIPWLSPSLQIGLTVEIGTVDVELQLVKSIS